MALSHSRIPVRSLVLPSGYYWSARKALGLRPTTLRKCRLNVERSLKPEPAAMAKTESSDPRRRTAARCRRVRNTN